MPRKKYALAKSNPPLNVRAPGFGSVEPWARAGDAVAADISISTQTLSHPPADFLRSTHGLPRGSALVREPDSERTHPLVAFATIEELSGRAKRLVFYAAVH